MLFTGWAYDTSVEEVMNSLHNLVVTGKVLYLVCSLFKPMRFDALSILLPGYLGTYLCIESGHESLPG